MAEIELQSAISEIRQACEGRPGKQSPFFFIVGAGISAPTIPLASEIEAECKGIALKYGRNTEPAAATRLETYSHWFGQAFPHPEQRQQYLRKKIEGKVISPAVFRLAHLLLDKVAGSLAVTTNFDDFLSRALTLFGEQHIVCDHPSTVSRISIESDDIQIIHVHGTYWFYDCCNLKGEIAQRAENLQSGPMTIPSFLEYLLWRRSPIVLGYSGWEGDVVMTALRRRLASPLPFNLYWFSYRRSDSDSLPQWIKENSNVRLVSPTPAARSEASQDGLSAGKVIAELSSGLGKSEDSLNTLPAQKILDQLIQSFQLESPALTRNPVRFLSEQLRRSLIQENESQSESDIYKFRSVIARLQAAAEIIGRKEANESAIETAMERVRDAVRRSAYAEAIKIALEIRLQDATRDQLEELMGTIYTAAVGVSADSEEQLAGYQLICKIAELAQPESIALKTIWAQALSGQGVVLYHMDRAHEAVTSWDEVVHRFGEASEPALREQVARALTNKGAALGRLNRKEEGIAVYDEVVRRFGEAPEPALREQVARALVNKGIALGQINRNDEKIAVYDEVVRRFGEAPEPALREPVAKALVSKGYALGQLNRNEEEIVVYDEVVRRFGEAPEPALREPVAKALLNKGVSLGQLNRNDEGIAVYDEVVWRFGEAPESALREQVATALLNKGAALGQLNRNDEGIAAYHQVVRRFGDDPTIVLQRLVADALIEQARVFKADNQQEKLAAVRSSMQDRFATHNDTEIQATVAEMKSLSPAKAAANASGD